MPRCKPVKLMELPPRIIAIAGPSGAGKSYLAYALQSRLPDANVLAMDSYYRELSRLSYEERCAVNFDHPSLIDDGLLTAHLEKLARGEAVERPVYHFDTHSRDPISEPFAPGQYLLLEGIFALYFERVRAMADLRVFVETPDNTCFTRRMDRDIIERGRTPASVTHQYNETVRPMALEYVWPTKRYADVVIPGDQNIEQSIRQVLDALPEFALAQGA